MDRVESQNIVSLKRQLKELVHRQQLIEDQITKLQVAEMLPTSNRAAPEARLLDADQLSLIADNLPALIAHVSAQQRYLFVNAAYCKFVDKPRNEIIGKTVEEIIGPKTYFQASPRITRVLQGEHVDFEEQFRPGTGEDGWIRGIYVPEVVGNEVVGFFALISDITEQKWVEYALRHSEDNFRSVLENVPDFIFTLDRLGHVLFANRHFPFVNREKLLQGESLLDIIPDESRGMVQTAVAEAIDEGKRSEVEIRIQQSDQEYYYACRIAPVGHSDQQEILLVATDISARRSAERSLNQNREELAHAWRLTTMAEMVTGLAHELNQPLTAIANASFVCQRYLDLPDELSDPLRMICDQSLRAGEIVRRIRAFVNRTPMEREFNDLNELVNDAILLVKDDLEAGGVDCHTRFDQGLPPVFADGIQLQQVLINLIRNGIDAVANTVGSKSITITTESTPKFVVMDVRDNGTGISTKKNNQVFDAFFTTKPDGMGMGLAISRTIIESHGGRLECFDNSEEGATFRVRLPTDDAQTAEKQPS